MEFQRGFFIQRYTLLTVMSCPCHWLGFLMIMVLMFGGVGNNSHISQPTERGIVYPRRYLRYRITVNCECCGAQGALCTPADFEKSQYPEANPEERRYETTAAFSCRANLIWPRANCFLFFVWKEEHQVWITWLSLWEIGHSKLFSSAIESEWLYPAYCPKTAGMGSGAPGTLARVYWFRWWMDELHIPITQWSVK